MTVGPTPGVLAIEVPYITVGLDELGLPEVEPGLLAVQAGLLQLLRASPPSPLSIFDGEGEEVLAHVRLWLFAARYGACAP